MGNRYKRRIGIIGVALFALLSIVSPMDVQAAEEDSKASTDMPTNKDMYITLAENTKWSWNANGSALQYNVIHLDDYSGDNKFFELRHVENEWYGIKHDKKGGTDIYVDVEGKSTSIGKVLHLYEDEDSKLGGKSNYHRHFAFYPAGVDAAGNQMYYIQIRHSSKWVGLEGNSVGENVKIIQTNKDNRKKWILTPAVVANHKNSTQLLKGDDTTGYCEFFEKGTMDAIDSKVSVPTKMTSLHHFELGTSSRWIIKWNSTYKAYEIEYSAKNEEGSTLLWDIVAEANSQNARLHLWDREGHSGNASTTQFWRFIKQSGGGYKIQNAANGLYVTPRYEGKISDDDYGRLCLSETGTVYEVDVYDGKEGRMKDSTNFAYADPWMSQIPDAAYLSSVNLPATHDTGTSSIVQDGIPQLSITSCQKHFYGSQLNLGTRAFDIRCNATKDGATAKDVQIVHGGELWQCFTRTEEKLTLDHILNESVSFLETNPTETVVLIVKSDAGSIKGLVHALAGFMKDNANFVWTGGGIPSMGEARGKIVFLRRFDVDTASADGVPEEWFGLNLKTWDDYDYMNQKRAIEIYKEDGYQVYVQDAYSAPTAGSVKQSYIKGTMEQTTGKSKSNPIPDKSYVFNFTSSAMLRPLETTRDVNPWLFEDKSNLIDNRRLGIMMLNFIDGPTSRLIYKTNNSNSKFYETKVAFPENVTLEYGTSLKEAEQALNAGETTVGGEFRFAEGNHVPTWEEYREGKEFELVFVPSDTRLKTMISKTTVTLTAKEMTIWVDMKSMIYGDTEPTLTYVCDKEELVVAEDGVEFESQISLSVSNRVTSSSGNLKTGSYRIDGISSSEKYNVTFVTADLKVKPRTLEIAWSDTSNLIYNGGPQNVTASYTNLVVGDDCAPKIVGGDAIGPSWDGDISHEPMVFEAIIAGSTGVDVSNYVLPLESLSKKYGIYREIQDPDDFAFPEKATLTYGQTLGEANLIGAMGSGTFEFVQGENNPAAIGDEQPNAGEHAYWMRYKTDLTTTRATYRLVEVTVNKKPVTASATGHITTYGTAWNGEFTFDSNQLVPGESEADLNVTLSAKKDEAEYVDAGSDAGIYMITGTAAQTSNYEVEMEPAYLLVRRKAVNPVWPTGTNEFVYNGSEVNIEATIATADLEGSDTCEVNVFGGDGVNVGNYYALATGLTNANYRLDLTGGALTWNYVIKQAQPTVTFPTSVTATYGQRLEEAQISGQVGEGSFVFEEGSEALDVSKSGTAYAMTFTPEDGNYESVTENVAVTVLPKAIEVRADSMRRVYGADMPELTWRADSAALVNEDSVDDLGITLSLISPEGEKKESDVGAYEIIEKEPIQWTNENYEVEFIRGWIGVQPLTLHVRWSDTSNLLYTGIPVNVTATLETVLFDDDCYAVVEGGNEIGPSWNGDKAVQPTVYTASVTELSGADKFNYALEEGENSRNYTIQKGESEDHIKDKTPGVISGGGKTGDDSNIVLWVSLLGVCFAIIGGLWWTRRKKRDKTDSK